MTKLIAIAIGVLVTLAILALSAMQPPVITLTKPADYGNIISAIGVARSGVATEVAVGTTGGVVTLHLPASH